MPPTHTALDHVTDHAPTATVEQLMSDHVFINQPINTKTSGDDVTVQSRDDVPMSGDVCSIRWRAQVFLAALITTANQRSGTGGTGHGAGGVGWMGGLQPFSATGSKTHSP